MNLYLCVWADCDGNNRDRMVQAESPKAAITVYIDCMKREEGFTRAETAAIKKELRVFLIPKVSGKTPRALDWNLVLSK